MWASIRLTWPTICLRILISSECAHFFILCASTSINGFPRTRIVENFQKYCQIKKKSAKIANGRFILLELAIVSYEMMDRNDEANGKQIGNLMISESKIRFHFTAIEQVHDIPLFASIEIHRHNLVIKLSFSNIIPLHFNEIVNSSVNGVAHVLIALARFRNDVSVISCD